MTPIIFTNKVSLTTFTAFLQRHFTFRLIAVIGVIFRSK
jgi:hypothetical protein